MAWLQCTKSEICTNRKQGTRIMNDLRESCGIFTWMYEELVFATCESLWSNPSLLSAANTVARPALLNWQGLRIQHFACSRQFVYFFLTKTVHAWLSFSQPTCACFVFPLFSISFFEKSQKVFTCPCICIHDHFVREQSKYAFQNTTTIQLRPRKSNEDWST